MKGWRITPLGWVVLIVLAGIAIYFSGKRLYRWLYPPPKGEGGQTSK